MGLFIDMSLKEKKNDVHIAQQLGNFSSHDAQRLPWMESSKCKKHNYKSFSIEKNADRKSVHID